MAYINGKKTLQVVKTQFVPAVYQEKTINPQNFTPEVVADSGYAALSKVKIDGILIDPHTEIESQTDTDIKYQKTVPAGALRYAGLNKLGGMSYKFNQLARPLNGSYWNYYLGSSGSISFNSNKATFTTSVQGGSVYLSLPLIVGHKYYISAKIKLTTPTTNVIFRHQGAISEVVITEATTNYQTLSRIITITGSSGTFQVLDNRTSDWDAIEISKVMCIDLTDIYGSGNEPTVEQFKATFNADYYDYTESTLRHSLVTSIESNEDYEIPSEVQALDGYGMGIDTTSYNYIDFENKKFIEKDKLNVITVVEIYERTDNPNCDFAIFQLSDNWSTNRKFILEKAIFDLGASFTSITSPNVALLYDTVSRKLAISVNKGTTLAQAKELLDNSNVLFELNTPVETDISQYIDQDTLDLGDYITFNNEYQQAVPSSITYLVEV